jgi:hypothetical protein
LYFKNTLALIIFRNLNMSEINITLTENEKEVLAEALESYLSELGMEITDTDQMDYREKLKARRTVIQKILKDLRKSTIN